ncbi:hypothetical protein GCM10018954_006760 [Kutzneria kofuensis]
METGGCNIQFAINPRTGRMVVIEMNPRVSRSSALASKATGFPIAKIAARLAIGYTLDEIQNDITGETPASFEPTLDYVVVKVPRFAFEKFPGADPTLTTTMKSVGEAMSIGRNFSEALNKALRSMETKAAGFWTRPDADDATLENTSKRSRRATTGGCTPSNGPCGSGRPWSRCTRRPASTRGSSTRSPRWASCVRRSSARPCWTRRCWRRAKRAGLSDRQIASLRPELAGEDGVRAPAVPAGRPAVFKTVDTCAAEFAARTPYHYSAYESDPAAETEVTEQRDRPKVLILGSGPNRIGQGIEFDYSCVHAAMELRRAGFETVMVNCNPETVSTDYDTSDRLYFEPLTFEDVLEVVHSERESGTVAGVIVQLGGQTPLGLAQRLADAGVPVVGTSPEAIHLAEDRGAFGEVLTAAGLPAPKYGTATSFPQAKRIADEIGYPVLVRPSYVLGGRGMEIVYDEETLAGYIAQRHRGLAGAPGAGRPVPRRRHRDRRGRAVRRRGGLPRRRDGAHRGGRHPLRRLLVRAAADHAGPQRSGGGPPLHRGHRARHRRARAAERAVRAQGRRPLRPGGQPPARRGRCRSCPRRRRCRWPRRRPGSPSAPPSPSCGRKASCRPRATAPRCPPTRRSR